MFLVLKACGPPASHSLPRALSLGTKIATRCSIFLSTHIGRGPKTNDEFFVQEYVLLTTFAKSENLSRTYHDFVRGEWSQCQGLLEVPVEYLQPRQSTSHGTLGRLCNRWRIEHGDKRLCVHPDTRRRCLNYENLRLAIPPSVFRVLMKSHIPLVSRSASISSRRQ